MTQTNNWQKLHDFLTDAKKTALRQQVMDKCGWSLDTFYRKLKNAPGCLSPLEREGLSKIYDVPADMLFPEPQTENVAA